MTVMDHTASPSSRMALSFQWPKRSFTLIYSSARLMPPVKPTFPSTIRNFRWSRLLSRRDMTGRKRLNTRHWMPLEIRYSLYSRGRENIQPMSS